ASIASITAALANAGGTNTTLTSAPVRSMASPTDANTGSTEPSKSTLWPALRGFTPPTMLLPALSIRLVCLWPSDPVMPGTMILDWLLRKIAVGLRPHRGKLGGLSGRVVHRVHLL